MNNEMDAYTTGFAYRDEYQLLEPTEGTSEPMIFGKGPRKPRDRHGEDQRQSSISLIDAAARKDFRSIKESLGFALGSSIKKPSWFPLTESPSVVDEQRLETNDDTDIPLQQMDRTGVTVSHDLENARGAGSAAHMPTIAELLSKLSERVAGSGAGEFISDETIAPPPRTNISGKFALFGDTDEVPPRVGPSSRKHSAASVSKHHSGPNLDQIPTTVYEKQAELELVVSSIGRHPNQLFGRSLGLFLPDSHVRTLCHWISTHKGTELVLLVLLFLQIVLLCYRQWSPLTMGGYYFAGNNWADYVLMAINGAYTVEIAIKVIAYGLFDEHAIYKELGIEYPTVTAKFANWARKTAIILGFHRFVRQPEPKLTSGAVPPDFSNRAYLKSDWHKLDFASMVFFWISVLLSINRYDVQHQITVFRAVSCIRILRLLNLTTGTTTILRSVRLAIPELVDISIFIACFMVLFAIIGVQSFNSSLTRHCVWSNPNDSTDTFVNLKQYCGSSLDINGTAQPYISRFGNLVEIKGFRCPIYSQCVQGANPYGGTVNFDNVLQSLEMVFVVTAANSFSDLMYWTMDTDSMVSSLFFVGCILVMNLWLLNVFIAIIVASYKSINEEVKDNSDTRHFIRFLEPTPQHVHEERIHRLKKRNRFLRYYYDVEFVFPAVIMVDLIIQCFRASDMSGPKRHTLYRFEVAFTAAFFGEILLRLIIHFPDWRTFFVSRRNCTDLFLAVVTLIIIIEPVKEALGQTYYWLTVFQIMRFYRVVLASRITRNLWLKIMGNIKAIYDLSLFYFILLFLYSIMIARYFEGAVPQDQVGLVNFPMNTLRSTFVGLYVITSSENWTSVVYPLQQYATTTSFRVFGAILLFFWFILTFMVVTNMFIAVIANTLEVSEKGKRNEQVLQFIDNMTSRLENIKREPGTLRQLKNRLFKDAAHKVDLEKAVVNLLLSGTAVNDFLGKEDFLPDEENVSTVSVTPWKRWYLAKYAKFTSLFTNPFYFTRKKKRRAFVEYFDPSSFTKTVMRERMALTKKQSAYLKDHPTFNRVFYLLGPRHRLRRFCQRIVQPPYGERIGGVEPSRPISEVFSVFMFLATIAIVVSACCFTPLYRLLVIKDGDSNWIFWFDVGFLCIYNVEFLIRITADGFCYTPNAYVRSPWNFIDLGVLMSLWIEFIAFTRNDGKLSRFVSGLKALRALRLLTISQTSENTFQDTMISGFGKIISAGIISFCLLFPFSIWGLNIFNGRLDYCTDGVSSKDACGYEYQNQVFKWTVMSPNVYTHSKLDFNRFSSSLSALFQIISLEGWSDMFVSVTKSTGVGTPPRTDASPFNGTFVILFNFTSTVFILTLFISVIISNYSRTTGRAFMTTEQTTWYQIKKILVQVRPSKRKEFGQLNWFRRFCYKMTVERNPYWTRFLGYVLLLHVIALLLDTFPATFVVEGTRQIIFVCVTAVVLINVLMLLVAEGRSFVQNKWNLFKLTVSVGAFVTCVIANFVSITNSVYNVSNLFFVLILTFLILRSNRLSQLLRFASAGLPAILSLLFTWFVMFLVFAIAMNQIFGLTKLGQNGTGNLNFRTIPKTLILLFRCSFGETWNYIMTDYMVEAPFCTAGARLDESDCGAKPYAYILFIAWNLVSMYIFVNLFISLILGSFSFIKKNSPYSKIIEREEIRKFKRAWIKYDPKGTGYIEPVDLPQLLHSLDGVLSLHIYEGGLRVPVLAQKWFIKSASDPYDITVNYNEMEQTLAGMDISRIKQRRRAYEAFIEEAHVNMELNNDPGISFTRILLQLPLYTAFDAGKCLNLIDFVERKLLMQKVAKQVQINRVYETAAAYVCRWKYTRNQKLGIKDTDFGLDFGVESLRSRSYFGNRKVHDFSCTDSDKERNEKQPNGTETDENDPEAVPISGFDAHNTGYVPKTPLSIVNTRHRRHLDVVPERPQQLSDTVSNRGKEPDTSSNSSET